MTQLSILECSVLKSVTNKSMTIDSTDFKTIVDMMPELSDSIALSTAFSDQRVKSILLMIYEDKNGYYRRRIALGNSKWTPDEVKNNMMALAETIHVDLKFN